VTFFVKGAVKMTENVTMGLQNRAEPEVDETGGFFLFFLKSFCSCCPLPEQQNNF
jgi:hypothetical protein